MKKLIVLVIIAAFGVMSGTAMACPKGTHPHGGTGSHHKGGTCY
ncbi:hypothetical protein [uncultured Enterobacter sp.]|nr:hypothetical protein [uncultured Enterobacter sp.]